MASSALANVSSRFRALPRNQQLAITFGIPVAIVIAFGYFTWKVMGELGADPGVPSVLRRAGKGKWAEITAVDDQIAEKQKIIERRKSVEDKLDALRADIADAEQRLPREAEKAQMREVIERLAREIPPELGVVKLKSVRIVEETAVGGAKAAGAAAKKGPNLATVIYQTEVSGDLNGLIKYIDSIEKNTRFMAVNTISFKGGGVKADPDSKGKLIYEPHSVKMDLVTYVYSSTTGRGPQ